MVPNQASLRQIAIGYQEWAAALFEDVLGLRLVQRSPEFGLFLFDLRVQILRQLSDDVLLLRPRQPEANSLQISIEEIPGGCRWLFCS
jgi:hypothetical protein